MLTLILLTNDKQLLNGERQFTYEGVFKTFMENAYEEKNLCMDLKTILHQKKCLLFVYPP